MSKQHEIRRIFKRSVLSFTFVILQKAQINDSAEIPQSRLNVPVVSLLPLWLPFSDNSLNRFKIIIIKRRGGMGGQAHVPSFILSAT